MDIMMPEFALTPETKNEILDELQKRGLSHAFCSACSTSTDLSFMRKKPEHGVNSAMCLPCFLHNHTDANPEDIDRMVEIGENNGWYFD